MLLRIPKAQPTYTKMYFNLACATAMQGKFIIAQDYLELTLKMNPSVFIFYATRDSDLKTIRKYDKYKKLIAQYKNDLTAFYDFRKKSNIVDRALKNNDFRLLRGLVHARTGLKLNFHTMTELFQKKVSKRQVDLALMERIVRDCYIERGKRKIESDKKNYIKLSFDYYGYSSEDAPIKSSWYNGSDFIFKKFGNKYFLVEIRAEHTGG